MTRRYLFAAVVAVVLGYALASRADVFQNIVTQGVCNYLGYCTPQLSSPAMDAGTLAVQSVIQSQGENALGTVDGDAGSFSGALFGYVSALGGDGIWPPGVTVGANNFSIAFGSSTTSFNGVSQINFDISGAASADMTAGLFNMAGAMVIDGGPLNVIGPLNVQGALNADAGFITLAYIDAGQVGYLRSGVNVLDTIDAGTALFGGELQMSGGGTPVIDADAGSLSIYQNASASSLQFFNTGTPSVAFYYSVSHQPGTAMVQYWPAGASLAAAGIGPTGETFSNHYVGNSGTTATTCTDLVGAGFYWDAGPSGNGCSVLAGDDFNGTIVLKTGALSAPPNVGGKQLATITPGTAYSDNSFTCLIQPGNIDAGTVGVAGARTGYYGVLSGGDCQVWVQGIAGDSFTFTTSAATQIALNYIIVGY